ncbi:MAG: hypothetical protein PUE83_08990 [Lachnobacterium sp.]|nr:hypothetical protein [Lachnobacterium sp.]
MLEAEVVDSMNDYLYRHGICYANEIRMGIGIPDISFNLGGNRRIKCLDDYYLFTVWDYIYMKKEVTFKEIGRQFLFSLDRVRKYVFQLAGMSLVKIRNEVVRVINNIKNARLGITVSVEAKVSDWKNGLVQAQRYLLFSDYSYLALPEKNINHVNIGKIQEAGIGLLSVKEKVLEEIIPAKKSEECEYYLKYMHTSVIFDKYKKENSKYMRRKDNIFSRFLLECDK